MADSLALELEYSKCELGKKIMKQIRKTKSIGQRMNSIKSYQQQEKTLLEWINDWERDFNSTHDLIRQAIRTQDTGSALRYSDQLRALTEKRFTGLENIVRKVCDPNRILEDRGNIREDNTGEDNVNEDNTDGSDPVMMQTPVPTLISQTETTSEITSIQEKVVTYYKRGKDVKDIAIMCQISDHKVTKILVTAGIFRSETYNRIKTLREKGKTDEAICDILKINLRTLDKYTPYKKGIYLSDTPSENTLRIRKFRAKKLNGD